MKENRKVVGKGDELLSGLKCDACGSDIDKSIENGNTIIVYGGDIVLCSAECDSKHTESLKESK